jgi:hypothetical protein
MQYFMRVDCGGQIRLEISVVTVSGNVPLCSTRQQVSPGALHCMNSSLVDGRVLCAVTPLEHPSPRQRAGVAVPTMARGKEQRHGGIRTVLVWSGCCSPGCSRLVAGPGVGPGFHESCMAVGDHNRK